MSDDSNDPFGGVLGDLHPYRERFPVHARLPERGVDREELFREVSAMAGEERARWERGQVSGTYYHGGAEHYAFLTRVFGLFGHANLLQRDLCPSGTKFEGEILSMVRHLLHGGDEVVGSITSGGTDSILHAMLVYRDWGRARGIPEPEVIAPESIHPAFQKAAHYFDLKLIRVPVGRDYRADVGAMASHIGPRTVALVGSAGNYPWGLIDPLAELSALAQQHALGLHVDGCLGGFILPFAERLGYPVPPFDFRLPGVTSMSCDTHKYGFGLKGSSVVLYRGGALRRHQYFRSSDWQGGVYVSPPWAGRRPAGRGAAPGAALVSLGELVSVESARGIRAAADTVKAGVRSIPELTLLGEPTFLIAFAGEGLDVFHVNDHLSRQGWRLNGCQHPAALHFCVTRPQSAPGVAEKFVADLRAAVAYAKQPHDVPASSGALYGLAGNPGGREMLDELLFAFLDATYEP